MKGKQLRRQLERMCAEQNGLCYWCKKEMALLPHGHTPHKTDPKNRATVDHLEDRWNPLRGTFKNQRRHVAACWECNNRRDHEARAKQMVEDPRVVWRRTGARPLTFIDIWEGFYRGWKSRHERKALNFRGVNS